MKVLKQPQQILLYSRAMCGWCIDAKRWLDEMGWKYEIRDTGKDSSARQEAIDKSGQTLVPVIDVDGLVLGDFDTDQLEVFLKENGYVA
jgi:glutaredoxin 3